MLVRMGWLHQSDMVKVELSSGAGLRLPHAPPPMAGHRAGWGVAAVLVGAATAAATSLAAAEPLPFRRAQRAFTAASEVRVFDGQRLWARAQAGGAWRPHADSAARVFDVDSDGDRLWVLDEGGVLVGEGGAAQRLEICRGAGSLAVARGTLWCADPAGADARVMVRRFSRAGEELHRSSVRVPAEEGEADLPPIARMARAWWFLLADDGGAVGVSLNRSQLLIAPAQGEPRVVPWSSPLVELRQRRPIVGGAPLRPPELHLRAALLLAGGQLLLLPAITSIDAQGVVTQADRLLVVGRDGTVHRSVPLPRRAAALVRDPAGPLILYEDDTLQPWRELAGAAAAPSP